MSNLETKQSGLHNNGQFKTTLGFVLACVGSAVGMGNIWLFPYRLGQYGGAAFLIPYFIFVALFGMVGLSAEFAIGRRAKTGTLGAYEYCWNAKGKGKIGYLLGMDSAFWVFGNYHRLCGDFGLGVKDIICRCDGRIIFCGFGGVV